MFKAEWFMDVLDSLEDLILIKGHRSQIVWGNKAFRDVYGVSEEALGSLVDSPHTPPDSTLQYVRDDHKVFTTGERLELIESVTHVDGTQHSYETVKTAVRDSEGKVTHTVGVSRRTKDRKRKRKSEEQQQARAEMALMMQGIVADFPIPMVILDRTGRIVAPSQGFCDLLGVPSPGQKFCELCPHQQELLESIDDVVSNGGVRKVQNVDFAQHQKTTNVHVKDWNLAGGVLLSFYDVTELKSKTEDLKNANEMLTTANHDLRVAREEAEDQHRKLETLLQTLSAGVIVSDKNGKITLFNGESQQIFGEQRLSSSQAEPVYASQLAPLVRDHKDAPVVPKQMPLRRALEGEVVQHELLMVPDPDTGFDRWFDASARPFLDGAMSVLLNITERITLQKELEEFAYVSSHDLQEPLRMIASYLELLTEEHGKELSPQARSYVDYAFTGTERMQALVRDLLTFSRTGSRSLRIQRVDIAELFDEISLDLSIAIKEAHAEVMLSQSAIVDTDRHAVRQILGNLISNAIKFRATDRSPKIEVRCETREDGWHLSVRDNGIGMDPARTGKIFRIFQRCHTYEEYPGTGIGLALCLRLATQLKGRIFVDTSLGQGSTFTLVLPREADIK